jgi:hypothetical protein
MSGMVQPWEGYRTDNELKFWPSDYLVRLCGDGLSESVVSEGWFREYRTTFHQAIWRDHHDRLTDLQARGLDLIVTNPDIGRGDFMNRLIALVHPTDGRTAAQFVHEEMEPIILGPYVGLGSSRR